MFDIDIINTKTTLGESGFYLYKTNEIVFLDMLNPTIFFYSLNTRDLIKYKLDLPKPLGNIYPLNNGNFIISCFKGLFIFNRRTKKIKKYIDVRAKNEFKDISYNDGTISKDKIWIGLCHIKETQDLGYFGYLQNNKFKIIDRGFKVSNGPALDKRLANLYFSDSFNSKIYKYDLKSFKKQVVIKFQKKHGFPDGLNPGIFSIPLEGTLSDVMKFSGPRKPLSGKVYLIRYKQDGSLLRKSINYVEKAAPGSESNPYLIAGDLINVKNSLLGRSTGIIKAVTAPFVGLYSAKEIINDFQN